MREALARCAVLWPGQPIRISAQAHLQRFYARHGFATVSDPYLDDGIAHVQMLRSTP
jgi:ElaA protein